VNRKAICFLVMSLLLTGCASHPQWVQAGKTEAETERDYNECYAQTQQRYGTNLETPHFKADLNQCMESRGYTRK
jgi:starvation-inducible outer membrane lipoprotein